jgi:prophage DNA circulation protein
VLIKQACVAFSLQQMSVVLAGMTFTSRQDVDFVRGEVNVAFDEAEEVAADEMALTVYRALISLHAAVTFHLYQTARPLPQMLDFRFAAIRPTLIQSYRLYADAGRADELREENKVVHPAFAPRTGRALSF